MSVIAVNAIGSSYVEVRVVLTDINNEFPRWPYPAQTISLPENFPVGNVFADLSAPDADTGGNALSTYMNNPADPNFQIKQDGSISSLKVCLIADYQFWLVSF